MNPITLHAANPGPFTGAGNWTYLIPGPLPLLFDAGVGAASHVEALAAAVPDGPAIVVVSHAHPDHASGGPALKARWPAARFLKHPWPGEDDAAIGWQPLSDGQVFDSGEGPLVVCHTPGHSPDHVALWHAESRTLFGADLMQLGNTVVIPADRDGDLAAYLRSLRRILALAPARVLPAHGPTIDDPAAVIEQYLQHRHHREVQILSALEGGLQTVAAITQRIYVGLTPALEPLARQNVKAHLIKLEKEGLARDEGVRWTLIT